MKNGMSWVMYCLGLIIVAANICDKLNTYETITCVIGMIIIRESGRLYNSGRY